MKQIDSSVFLISDVFDMKLEEGLMEIKKKQRGTRILTFSKKLSPDSNRFGMWRSQLNAQSLENMKKKNCYFGSKLLPAQLFLP